MKPSYKPFETFVFRTPALPVNMLEDELFQETSFFQEGLLVASAELFTELQKYNKEEKSKENQEKAKLAVYRYFQRSCTRSTPFGLFAGCSTGELGKNTEIKLVPREAYLRFTRLDMHYVCSLIKYIEEDRKIREQLTYYPNTSIYRLGDTIRFVDFFYKGTKRSYRICSIANSDYLDILLDLATNGASFGQLADILIDEEINLQDAIEFIHDLIDAQVLVSELEPSVTEPDFLIKMIYKLEKLKNTENLVANLKCIQEKVGITNQPNIGKLLIEFPRIIDIIKSIGIDYEPKFLLQSDMAKPTLNAIVNREILTEIYESLIFLNKITPRIKETRLNSFRNSFYQRYEYQTLPLLQVLDNELGLGYPINNDNNDISPLIDDLTVPINRQGSKEISFTAWYIILLKKYFQVIKAGKIEIILTDDDVRDFKENWDDLPLTLAVMCQILQDNKKGRSIFVKHGSGSSASNLIGRFCHTDAKIFNLSLQIVEKERQLLDDVIFAEIVHLPEDRLGNILLRPVLRDYEIPCLSASSASKDHIINLSDLSVSIDQNKVILRSKSLNKRVIPRMSNSHNFSTSTIPAYLFLCDLQHQDGRWMLGFNWGEIAKQFDFLPRVKYKNCILSKACWIIVKKEIEQFLKISNDSDLIDTINNWRTNRNMPKKVVLVDGDNELFINLNYPLSIRSWLTSVKNRTSFRLEEFIFDEDTAVVISDEGSFNNEFIFSFYKSNDDK